MSHINTDSNPPNIAGQASLSQADFARGQSLTSYTAGSAEPSNPSTGPRTDAGKSISSRNAVKHNLCATKLSGTDLEEYQAISADLIEEWEPSTETERMLIDQMALSRWRMERALSLELNAFNEEQLDEKLLSLAIRYRSSAERSFYKALGELQRLRATRREDERQAGRDEEKQMEAAIERWVYAPMGRAQQFVLQNGTPAAPASLNPEAEAAKAGYLAKLKELNDTSLASLKQQVAS